METGQLEGKQNKEIEEKRKKEVTRGERGQEALYFEYLCMHISSKCMHICIRIQGERWTYNGDKICEGQLGKRGENTRRRN